MRCIVREQESDDDDEEARPLTHQELKAKTMKVIHRRAHTHSKAKKGAARR
jgi:hypothetical protein